MERPSHAKSEMIKPNEMPFPLHLIPNFSQYGDRRAVGQQMGKQT